MAQRLTSAELPRRTAPRQTRKDFAKQQFYAVFIFSVKSKGLQPLVVFSLQLAVALQPLVVFRLQPVDALQPLVVFPLQPMDALQPLVVFPLQPIDALQPPVVFPLQPMDAWQPWVGFNCNRWMHGNRGLCSAHSVKKEGMVKPSLLIFNQRFRASECGYVCEVAPRTPAPGRAPQGG